MEEINIANFNEYYKKLEKIFELDQVLDILNNQEKTNMKTIKTIVGREIRYKNIDIYFYNDYYNFYIDTLIEPLNLKLSNKGYTTIEHFLADNNIYKCDKYIKFSNEMCIEFQQMQYEQFEDILKIIPVFL